MRDSLLALAEEALHFTLRRRAGIAPIHLYARVLRAFMPHTTESPLASDASPGRRETALVAALCALGAAFVFWRFRELRQDDAFITFQYARNIATGHGFVFNPGEHILGTTSPLHALVMAFGHLLVGEALPLFAIAIGALGMAAQAFFLFLLLRKCSVLLAAMMAALVLGGFGDGLAFISLETNGFAGLLLATVWAWSARRPVLCGVLLGLCFLCRYDAALLVPVIAASWWLREREQPRVLLGVSFTVVAPWLLWATWYFGSFLPQTFFAKQQITPSAAYLAHYAEFIGDAPWRVLLGASNPLLRALSFVAAIAGVGLAIRRVRAVLPFFVFSVLLVLAYGWMGPHFLQHWHLYPAMLAFQVAVVVGVFGWLGEAQKKLRSAPARSGAILLLVAAGLVMVVRVTAVQLGRSQELVASYWLGERDSRYQQIAAWLRQNVRPDRSFLALEVGTLGYYSRLRMIDPYGLINETNSYPRDPTLESLLELVDRYKPDVMLVNTPEQGAMIEQLQPFRMVKVFPSDPWSTVLVRGPEALLDSTTAARLRAELPPRAVEEINRAKLGRP